MKGKTQTMSRVRRTISCFLVLLILISMVLVGVSAAETTASLTYSISNGEVTIVDYSGNAAKISIPEKIEGLPVTSIGEKAFYYCSRLKSVDIPSSVTSIGDYAFNKCDSLKSIVIPEGVTSIGKYTFYNCSGLESVDIPSSVKSIGEYAFSYCTELESISIPSSVTSIEAAAFYNCESLISIVVPEGVTSIGMSTFSYCSSLESVDIPSSVTSIGDYAFNKCDSLKSIVIPESVKNIGEYAFLRCSSLESVDIPASVTSVGNSAFRGCGNLKSVNIPSSVTSIGENTFYYCDSLKNIVIPEGVTSIGKSAFYECSSLESVSIPSSVTSIGENGFKYADNLKHISFGGTEEQWEQIAIDAGNTELTDITVAHYNTSGDCIAFIERVEPSCTEIGYDLYKCSVCDFEMRTELVEKLFHDDFVDGMCSRCEMDELDAVQFAYQQPKNGDKSWTIVKTGAKSITLNFSEKTDLEDGEDHIYIYNSEGSRIGRYSGTMLAGESITVLGDKVTIRFDGGVSEENYGFSLDSIVANYDNVPAYPDNPKTGIKVGDKVYDVEVGDKITYEVDLMAAELFENIQGKIVYDSDLLEIDFSRFKNTAYEYEFEVGNKYWFPSKEIRQCAIYGHINVDDWITFASMNLLGFDCSNEEILVTIDFIVKDNSAYSEIKLLMEEMWIVGGEKAYFSLNKDAQIITEGISITEKLTVPEKETTAPPADITTEPTTETSTEPVVVPTLVPVTTEPTTQETDPTEATDTTQTEPVTSEPGTTEPATQETDPTEAPVTTQTEPVTSEPVTTDPTTQETDPTEATDTTQTEPVTTEPTTQETDSTENVPDVYLTDEKTNISVGTTTDASLIVFEVTDENVISDVDLILVGEKVSKGYDITLQIDGIEVQPDGMVWVRIPTENPDSKVYRVEKDGKLTDMGAVYQDGFLEFVTDHFSIYIVAEPDTEPVILGDADGDGVITIKDATLIQKAIANLVSLSETRKKPADVDNSGNINIKDATAIQKHLAGFEVGYPIGKEIEN